jgi:hypothetical protein
MKLIIAGGRDYQLTEADYARLDFLLESVTEVVSGNCRTGADQGGIKWANKNNIPVKKFTAQWERHGRKAGPLRNREMAEYADALVVFPGGKGTYSMLAEAKAADLLILDWRAP